MSRRTKQHNRPIQRNNAATIERANRAGNVYYGPQGIQGNYSYGGYGKGTSVTIPASVVATMLQSMAPQKNQSSEYAPGSPLRPYQGVIPKGGPRIFSYPVGINLQSGADRTLGHADVPSFAQLRSFAQLYEGIALAERVVLDLIPKLRPKVGVRRDLIAQGAKVKDFQDAIKRWMPFVEMPDPAQKMDIHSWLRMAWIEQTQIDALSIFKQMNRGGKLFGLQIISGDTIKPLLNERGMTPMPPYPAYQQYPYGVPGDEYTTDQMVYYRESPRAYTPYGFSRIERIITRVNQALRKEQKDLSHFTEGNVPAGMMEVPDASTWTPDQIDAYEQAWNALIAGSQQQQSRIKFTQPGMKYTQFEDPINAANVTEFDMFLLNVTLGCYGLGMGDIGFTEDIHKSSGDSQENMMYRRTLHPTISIYSRMLTSILVEAFGDEELEVTFSGFEELEDLEMQSEAYSRLIEHAVISPCQVAKIMGLPEIPETGPFITSPGSPPLFLDTLADQTFRQSLTDAHMDILHNTTNPSQSQSDEAGTSQSAGVSHSVSRMDTPSEPHSGSDTERSSMTLMERQLAELLERVESLNSKLIRYDPAHDTQTGQFSTYKVGQQLPSTDSEKEEEETHTGMMVAFMLKPETAKQLALPDGEPANILHCTLAFLGDSREVALDERTVKRELASFASESLPLIGTTGGLARFAASESSDNQSPIVALVQVPGLSKFREALVTRLESIGVQVAHDFDFTAHITLKYIPADAEMPIDTIPTVPLTFDTLCLAIGDEHTYFKMGDEQYPQYWEEKERDESASTSQRAATRFSPYLGGRDSQTVTIPSRVSVAQLVAEGTDTETLTGWRAVDRAKAVSEECRRWRSRAIDDIKQNRPLRGFTTTIIPKYEHALISAGLARCSTIADVKNVFEIVRTGMQVMDEPQKVSRMGECQCDVCMSHDGKPLEDGKEPPFHEGCGCSVAEMARV